MKEENTQNNENIEEPFDSAQGKLNEIELKCNEYLNKWKRAEADFINYKKGELERVQMIARYAKEDLIQSMLPILDSIDLAQQQMPEEIKNNEWSKGFMQTKQQIEEFLKREGIEEIEALGKSFDLTTMEAIGEIDGEESEKVVEIFQKGYKMGGQVLRPVKVKVIK